MIVVRIWEGLGNQMFQYAYARALVAKGQDVRLDMNKAYDRVFAKYKNNAYRQNSIQNFRISLPTIDVCAYGKYAYLDQNTIIRKVVFWLACHSLWKYRFYEEVLQGYSEKSAKLRKNCYIKGWFQSEKYFQDIRPTLLKEFTPRKKIRISGYIKRILENEECISLHVRRGDYVRIHHVLHPIYYKNAISYMSGIYHDPVFLVFSDDLEWVKRNIPIEGRCIYVNEDGNLKDYEELFIMSRCKSNIISNSTFSWWGAWLNRHEDKTVVAPKIWMDGQSGIVPDKWIVL